MKYSFLLIFFVSIALSTAVVADDHNGGAPGAAGAGGVHTTGDMPTTKDGFTCVYNGRKEIINPNGCGQVCLADASCKKVLETKTDTKTGDVTETVVKKRPTLMVCKAVGNECPGPNTCWEDRDVLMHMEGQNHLAIEEKKKAEAAKK